MTWKRWPYQNKRSRSNWILMLAASAAALGVYQFGPMHAGAQQSHSEAAPADSQDADILIKTDSELPETSQGMTYLVHLLATGGVPPFHWRQIRGALPPGIKLEETGLLHGAAERGGEFQFTLRVHDAGTSGAVEKQFTIRVRSALIVNWKTPAHVNGNRIEGSVQVTNTTPDDMDLTFIVLAVSGNGRATAIGYQHFPLPKDTVEKELPFGDTLPRGGYVVHIDVVGEVAPKNAIYRERMETPKPLQVALGP